MEQTRYKRCPFLEVFVKEWDLGDILGQVSKRRMNTNDKIFTHPI